MWWGIAHDRDNVRGVVRGIVRYNHPVLGRGLRLVDMAGVHASSLVNQEAKRFLAEETHAVVAITYGRPGFGALHEVFDDLAVQRDLVQAVVINQELGYFATSDLTPLPDAKLRTKLAETRDAAAEELGILEHRIFILNLASFYGTRVHGEPPLDSPAHKEEDRPVSAASLGVHARERCRRGDRPRRRRGDDGAARPLLPARCRRRVPLPARPRPAILTATQRHGAQLPYGHTGNATSD